MRDKKNARCEIKMRDKKCERGAHNLTSDLIPRAFSAFKMADGELAFFISHLASCIFFLASRIFYLAFTSRFFYLLEISRISNECPLQASVRSEFQPNTQLCVFHAWLRFWLTFDLFFARHLATSKPFLTVVNFKATLNVNFPFFITWLLLSSEIVIFMINW